MGEHHTVSAERDIQMCELNILALRNAPSRNEEFKPAPFAPPKGSEHPTSLAAPSSGSPSAAVSVPPIRHRTAQDWFRRRSTN